MCHNIVINHEYQEILQSVSFLQIHSVLNMNHNYSRTPPPLKICIKKAKRKKVLLLLLFTVAFDKPKRKIWNKIEKKKIQQLPFKVKPPSRIQPILLREKRGERGGGISKIKK